MASNILRGGGKAQKEAVQGLKDLERKLKALATTNPGVMRYAQAAVAGAASELRDEMKTQARAAGWGGAKIKSNFGKSKGKTVTGDQAINSIFSFGKPKESTRNKVSALAGVTKSETMFTWRAANRGRREWLYRNVKRNVEPGGEVAMSLATALEFGTSNRPAKPAIRTAVKTARARMIERITRDWKSLLEGFSK